MNAGRRHCVADPHPLLFCLSATAVFLFVTLASPSAVAEHPSDEPYTCPTGTFTASNLIVVNNGYKTGRWVYVDLNAINCEDIDRHYSSGSYTSVSDGIAEYKWVITNLAISSPLNLTGASTQFLTKKTGTGTGSIALKLKDNGTHIQEYDPAQTVASIAVEIVDPDGIYIKSRGPVTQHPTLYGGYQELTWQLTYSGVDLPFESQIKEKITYYNPISNSATYNISLGPYENPQGTPPYIWNQYPFSPTPTGGHFVDPQELSTSIPPITGTYDVVKMLQQWLNVEAGNTPIGSTFTIHMYYDHTGAFTHASP